MTSRFPARFSLFSRKSLGIFVSLMAFALVLMFSLFPLLARGTGNVHAHGVANSSNDWPTYLADNQRHSYNSSETILNPQTVSQMKIHWQNQSGAPMASEPVVANGLVYWGSWDGYEHATDPSTGTDVWKTFLGQTKSCLHHMTFGVQSTATITSEVINGVATTVDIVGGGDAQLYALDANQGTVLWHTPLSTLSGSFIHSSPAVYNGSVYIGLSSADACPFIPGQMLQVNASTGAIQNTFNVVPNGCLGGGIWGSPAIDSGLGLLYIATGSNVISCHQREPLTDALLALHTTDLSLVASWKIPKAQQIGDGDFGSTPTFFEASSGGTLHHMVGLINKNSYYYAFDRTNIAAGPLWEKQIALPGYSPEIGKGSIASSAVNTQSVFVATGAATLNGKSCAGSLASLKQGTGTLNWQMCLNAPVLAPVISTPGLVVVGVGNTMEVIDAVKGVALYTYQDTNSNSLFWGAATISNGVLYEENMDGTLDAFGL